MSLQPPWMRQSRVFVRTAKRIPDGVDITDAIGGGGTTGKCSECRAHVDTGADMTAHLAWHAGLTSAVMNHPHGVPALTTHNHTGVYSPAAQTSSNHPHGPVTVAEE
jgi:hypothetical protein